MRRIRRVAAWTLGLLLVSSPIAFAEYRGSDVLGNIGPESQVVGGLVDKYPLSAYALDYHVDVGLTNPDGVPPMIAQWAAAQLWNATSFLVKTVIDLFTWAFSLDLLGGSGGALAPVSNAITNLYDNVIGQAWMVAAILVAGVWGIWKALMQRRYTETAGAFGLSVVFVLIALFFVYQPERTIGQASQWTNQLSLAFLSGTTQGSLDDPQGAKRQVADQLFDTLVYKPWAVLEFGGLSHCVDTRTRDSDGFPKPVSPHDPSRNVCRDHLKPDANGFGGYAPRFLAQAPGSDERDAEYEALKNGELPSPPKPQFAGYRVDKSDAPAVDIQQAGGAYQRLTVSVVIFAGALGAVCLLGFLSLAVILAQVVALVLLGFAPVALIIGIFPGAGHDIFRSWLTKLATAVFIKALYSLVIAIVVAVAGALTSATGSLGFLFAFGLETIFFWAIFLYRKQITSRLVSATSGAGERSMPKMTVVQRGADAASKPFSALVGAGRRGEDGRSLQQESAIGGAVAGAATGAAVGGAAGIAASGSGSRPPAGTVPSGDGTGPQVQTWRDGRDDEHEHEHLNGNGGPPQRPDGAPGVPAPDLPSVEHEGFPDTPVPPVPPAPPPDGERDLEGPIPIHAAPSHRAAVAAEHGYPPVPAPADRPEATPRASHEDVMRRARDLRERQRETIPPVEERSG